MNLKNIVARILIGSMALQFCYQPSAFSNATEMQYMVEHYNSVDQKFSLMSLDEQEAAITQLKSDISKLQTELDTARSVILGGRVYYYLSITGMISVLVTIYGNTYKSLTSINPELERLISFFKLGEQEKVTEFTRLVNSVEALTNPEEKAALEAYIKMLKGYIDGETTVKSLELATKIDKIRKVSSGLAMVSIPFIVLHYIFSSSGSVINLTKEERDNLNYYLEVLWQKLAEYERTIKIVKQMQSSDIMLPVAPAVTPTPKEISSDPATDNQPGSQAVSPAPAVSGGDEVIPPSTVKPAESEEEKSARPVEPEKPSDKSPEKSDDMYWE